MNKSLGRTVWISLKRNCGADKGRGGNWGIGKGGGTRKLWKREEITEERESKRIEESNRRSNYRSRDGGLMTKNRGKRNKEQDERRAGDTVRAGSLLSRWINYADQITERRKLGHYEKT